MAAGAHPDLRQVEPVERDDDGTFRILNEIPVDRIRELTRWALLSSHRGRAKVAVIAPAETMNVAAANALLKTLEEPPPETYLLLVTHRPGRVPATLRSRCRRYVAPGAGTEAASLWLAEHGVADAGIVLAQSGGAPLLALAQSDPAWQAERALWLQTLAKPEKPVGGGTGRAARGGAEGRAQGAACNGDRLACRLDRRSRSGRSRRGAGAESRFRRSAGLAGERGGADPLCFAIIGPCCSSALWSRIRCNRVSSPRRC